MEDIPIFEGKVECDPSSDFILSDVHIHKQRDEVVDEIESIPLYCTWIRFLKRKNVSSHIEVRHSPRLSTDSDGDIEVPRKPTTNRYVSLAIMHSLETSIADVGLQLWSGSMLLCEYLLAERIQGPIIELGCGPGLPSIILGHLGQQVIATDYDQKVLSLVEMNVRNNCHCFTPGGSVIARILDLETCGQLIPPELTPNEEAEESKSTFQGWDEHDKELLYQASFIIASDIIYSEQLTDALFRQLRWLMTYGKHKKFLLSIEKRINFSIQEMEPVATGYGRLMCHLQIDKCFEHKSTTSFCDTNFRAEMVQCHLIPHYFSTFYDKSDRLEIWIIEYS